MMMMMAAVVIPFLLLAVMGPSNVVVVHGFSMKMKMMTLPSSASSASSSSSSRRSFLSQATVGTAAATLAGVATTTTMTAVLPLPPAQAATAATTATTAKPQIYKLSSGIKYAVLKDVPKGKGGGGFPQPGDIVAIEYTGYLTDGAIFDGTHSEGKQNALLFKLGSTAVIPGFNEMVSEMKVGQVRFV